MRTEGRIYLVDAHAYLHRAYHAMPPLKNAAGEPVGALFGFAKTLLGLIRREKPDYFAVCFDAPGPTFRHKKFEQYKATRKPTEPDLKSQLKLSRELTAAMGLPCAELSGWEADDIIATLSRRAVAAGLEVVVVSGDKDALQLVGGPVKVLNEAKGVVYDPGRVSEKFGVPPERIVDYLAIVGDSSDNVPGVPGIGPVGAVKLLIRFGSLDAVIEAAKKGDPAIPAKAAASLRENEEKVRFGRELVTLDADAPVPLEVSSCRLDFRPRPELSGLLERFEFHSLRRELGVGAAVPAVPAKGAEPAPSALKIVPAKELLKAAAKAEVFGLEAAAAEGDLLDAGGCTLALALPDGRAAHFGTAELRTHRAALAELLSGAALKCAYDLKDAGRLLSSAGLELSGPVFDCRLAAWCLDPGRERLDLHALLGSRPGPQLEEKPSPEARAAALPALAAALRADLEAGGLLKVYEGLELPLIAILADMERAGIALDVEYLQGLREEFAEVLSGLQKETDALAGCETNLNSPKQIGELLYGKLGLKPFKKTKGGAASTDEESLQALAAEHPVPAKILAYREVAKLQSTYVEGLLSKVSPSTRRVHTHFEQTGTATGRLSSQDPNLQNIPVRTPLGQKIRRAFVAGKGRVLLSADYSQIELRVLAHLSGDPALRAAFSGGEDVHRRTAAEVFGVKEAEVTREMRRRAKAVNFGIIYGQTPHGLSRELGIPMAEAKDVIERYFARYKGVKTWIEKTLEEARREESVRTLFGRVRRLPQINERNFNVRSFTERAAVNTPIQGTAADLIKAAMIAVHAGLAKQAGGKARLLLQVHDELLFELPEGALEPFARWVKGEMEGAVRLEIPVLVDLKAGADWRDMEKRS
ncbi:MAG: DNA polymerase I [Elusimicrobiota bacterium]|jgi:DNA polymerase-1